MRTSPDPVETVLEVLEAVAPFRPAACEPDFLHVEVVARRLEALQRRALRRDEDEDHQKLAGVAAVLELLPEPWTAFDVVGGPVYAALIVVKAAEKWGVALHLDHLLDAGTVPGADFLEAMKPTSESGGSRTHLRRACIGALAVDAQPSDLIRRLESIPEINPIIALDLSSEPGRYFGRHIIHGTNKDFLTAVLLSDPKYYAPDREHHADIREILGGLPLLDDEKAEDENL